MVRSQPTEDFDPGSFLEHNRFRNSFRVQALMENYLPLQHGCALDA